MSKLAKRLLTAEFSGYPAHGSGFVTILSAYEPGANIKADLQAAHDRIEELEAKLGAKKPIPSRCPVCGKGDNAYMDCDYAGCTDGRGLVV